MTMIDGTLPARRSGSRPDALDPRADLQQARLTGAITELTFRKAA